VSSLTDINSIKLQIRTNFRNQRTPVTYTDSDYLAFSVLGCKRFYRDTGKETLWDTEFSVDTLSRDLNVTEYEYCVLSAEIELIKSIRNYWNTMVSYTTNALTIANAFKPFEFMEAQIKEKENELIGLFHKMTDVANPSSTSDIDVDSVDYTFS
jgi:hypothetical protein